MNIIRLDHKTIRNMMAEDEDFRIEVKKAILNTAVTGRTTDFLDATTRAEIATAMEEAMESYRVEIRKVVKEYGDESWQKWTPSPHMRQAVKETVLAEFRQLVVDHL